MADRSSQLILTALSRAAAGDAPLHASRAAGGLFPATAAGKHAASQCQADGYLRAGTNASSWGLTEKGLAFLLNNVSPREVLSELVRVLESRTSDLAEVQTTVQKMLEQLVALRAGAEQVLRQIHPEGADGSLNAHFQAFSKRASADCAASVIAHLTAWQRAGSTGDCALPDLYRAVQKQLPRLTTGEFHDALRQLHAAGKVYLHPWTGPLYEMPEPSCALLVGHEVAFYASSR